MNYLLDMKKPIIAARNRGTLWILGVAVLFPVAAYLLRSTPGWYVGLVVIVVALRVRQQPAGWGYACFALVALAGSGWIIASLFTTSPLLGALPLMLSYVIDHLDERRQKRKAPPTPDLPEGQDPAASITQPDDQATRP